MTQQDDVALTAYTEALIHLTMIRVRDRRLDSSREIPNNFKDCAILSLLRICCKNFFGAYVFKKDDRCGTRTTGIA